MASYYAQIDVNLYEGDGNLKKATTPKPTMLLTTKPKVQTNKQKNFTFPTKITTALIASASFANSSIGAYTGNKNLQSNISSSLGILGVGIATIKNPILGAIAISSYAIKRSVDISIQEKNSYQQSMYNQSYLGRMTTSNSRWRG